MTPNKRLKPTRSRSTAETTIAPSVGEFFVKPLWFT